MLCSPATANISTVNPPPISPARPFLKWAGGKGRVLPQYQPYFPEFSTFSKYYEPFLGGGAVFFYLQATNALSSAYLTDINEELVNVYRCIRDEVEAVVQQLEQHRDNHDRDYYYHIRAIIPSTPVQRAARLLYLNKTCFNGLYRENSQGRFNVPLGRYKKPNICPTAVLQAAARSLQSVHLSVSPFDRVLEQAHTSQDFVYFDPPYHPISPTSNFTGYSRYSFQAEDQIRLRDTFAMLASRGVKVMLSNSDCPFIQELYQDFQIHTISATRAINSKASKRGKITEVLVTSY
ncbi:MAG: DNA adenine methylase [Cyanothece sp. SIO2G6]|nr:DNA adenine methylase [Cyanothece sp. SIO2G6]